MRFYLEYINHLGRLNRRSSRRRAEAGFTLTEVLLAGLMMLIAVMIAGVGVITMLRNNYKANADSEIQNGLNRTLEFVSEEVRRARIIADAPSRIVSSQIPTGSQAVLAFQIPDPNNPSQPFTEQIVYYMKSQESTQIGPRVLWRYGPSFDDNGNYITPTTTSSWNHSPLQDMLADAANVPRRDCDPFRPGLMSGWQRIPNDDSQVQGFYTCVRDGGTQVALNASAQVNMTTNDSAQYAVSTKVSTRATNSLFFLAPPSGAGAATPGSSGTPPATPDDPQGDIGSPVFSLEPSRIILTQDATTSARLIQNSLTNCTDCRLRGRDIDDTGDRNTVDLASGATATVQANSGADIIIYAGGMSSSRGTTRNQIVNLYTSDQTIPPTVPNVTLTNNQVLVVLTDIRSNPNQTYVVLVNIVPR